MKKSLAFGALALTVVGAIGIGSISASALEGETRHIVGGQGAGYQASLDSRASMLGMSPEALQKELETKTMSQIAVERGISEETFRAKMIEAAKIRWEARGLSAEEIANRIAEQAKRQATNSANHEFGSGNGKHMGGYGKR